MGGSWREVVQVLVVGITIEVVGSIVALLLWKFIVLMFDKYCHHTPPPLLPLSAVAESANLPLTEANGVYAEMETLNDAEVVASEAIPITPATNAADALPSCLRT